MKPVFADAFYFVALLNRADQHHAGAVAYARQARTPVITTEWVLAEVADALAGKPSRSLAAAFIGDLARDPEVTIVPATTDLFQRGLRLYAQRPDKQWSLTDCLSFVVMTDARIQEALTGDEHFKQAGFTALLM
jgi:predicted nucleic acid-binding protein